MIESIDHDISNLLKDCRVSKCLNREYQSEYLHAEFSEEIRKFSPFFEMFNTVSKFIEWINEKNKLNDNIWLGISGSWRTINQKIINDTATITRKIINSGNGILTGGALGIDYLTTEIVLKEGDPKNQLRIALPINRFAYMEHFSDSSFKKNGVTDEQRDSLIKQLGYIESYVPEIIFDQTHVDEEKFLFYDFINPDNVDNKIADKRREDYYDFRNGLVAYGCDGLVALCVNSSKGVLKTLGKVENSGKPFRLYNYSINVNSRGVINDYSKLRILNSPDNYPLSKKSSEKTD